MRVRRFHILYWVLLPAIIAAACILGYYTLLTASQFERLGEESIAESTLLLVREKVERIERQVINADNAVFHLVDLSAPLSFETEWPPLAPKISPSVRALLVLDENGNPISAATRSSPRERLHFLKIFFERILPDLDLEHQPINQLKHWHRTVAGQNYLISYLSVKHEGQRYYLFAHHDTGYIVREEFSSLFANEAGKQLYNVVDENNRRVFGPDLARAGDYLVGRRFPTTLYNWRLQVAPKQAPLLKEKGRFRRFNEGALIGFSFAVILLGMAFFLYAANKERRLNNLKSDFIANVSHELKTPISVIRMFSEMLLTNRVRTDEKRREYLEMIGRESDRLSGLVENVLDFAALERGKQRYEMKELDLVAIVERALETFRSRTELENTELHVVHSGDQQAGIRADEQSILLAILNLLDNAVKYGDGKKVELRLEWKDREVVLSVRDWGPGIPDEDLKRVFERFYRSRKSRSARGSGIGLSLVTHIVQDHGGRAWAKNAPDGGAVVYMALPLIRRKSSSRAAVRPSAPPNAEVPAATDAAVTRRSSILDS